MRDMIDVDRRHAAGRADVAGGAGAVRVSRRPGGVHAQLAVCLRAAAGFVRIERRRAVRGRADARRARRTRRPRRLADRELAINAYSEQPDAAYQLIDYLLQPEQMIERARVAGQFPPRPALLRLRRPGRRAADSARRCAADHRTRGAAAGHPGLHAVVGNPSDLAAPRADPAAGSSAALQDAAASMRRLLVQTRPTGARRHDAAIARRRQPRLAARRGAARLGACAAGDRPRSAWSPRSRSSGRSGNRCTCTTCACRGSAGPSSAPPTTVEALDDARFAERGRAHAAVRRRHGDAGARRRSGAGARAEPRRARPRAAAHGHAAALGHPDRRRRAGLALHVREPGRDWRPAARRAGLGVDAADLVRRRGRPPGCRCVSPTSGRRRRLSRSAARRAAEYRSDAVRSGRRSTAPDAWRQFTDITLPLLRPALLVAVPLSRARRASASSTSST